MRCDFAHDDGAYVLGALSPAERSAYERHLATCPACREAVAEIAVLPGLLGRLDPATALQLLAEDEPPGEGSRSRRQQSPRGRDYIDDARVTSMLAAAAQKHRRDLRVRRFRYASAALAAACVALVAAFGLGMLPNLRSPGGDGGTDGDTPVQVQMAAMDRVGDLPINAEVGIVPTAFGTEIVMECDYEKNPEHTKAWPLLLVAVGPGDESEQVGSWMAAPGEHVSIEGASRFAADELVRLEMRTPSGRTLMRYDVP